MGYSGTTAQSKTTAKISLDQIANGDKLQSCISQYENLKYLLETKDLSNVRMKNESINKSDLSSDLQDALESTFDDSYLRNKIGVIETILSDKVEKCDLLLYRKASTLININDLDSNLKALVNKEEEKYDDTDLWKSVDELESSKTDKSESGLVKNLDEKLVELTKEEYGKVTLVTAINWIFNYVYNWVEEQVFGSILDTPTSIVSYGTLTDEVKEVLDFGTLYANS
jgi:hypothetical protein